MAETHGANWLAKIAQPFIERIEAVQDDLESLKGEYMNRCKARREEIKTIYGEAKDKGVPKRPLKGIIKHRALQRKIDDIENDFEIDESAIYRELVEGLGPLGQAAAVRAGYGKAPDDDDTDVRPGFMKRAEAERAQDDGKGDLSKVGRGPVDKQAKPQDPVDAIST